MTYNMDDQRRKEEEANKRLDAHYSERFHIHQVTRGAQRTGRDRMFIDKLTGEKTAVEYKADWKTQRTGNVFVETISVDTQNKPGWALTCTADRLFYYVIGSGFEQVYILSPEAIRRALPRWERSYPIGRSPNPGYFTHGVLVPLAEFERLALEVDSL